MLSQNMKQSIDIYINKVRNFVLTSNVNEFKIDVKELKNTLEEFTDVDKRGILHWCVIENEQSKLEICLKLNISPNLADNAGWTPLHLSAAYSNLTCTNLLISFGANVNVQTTISKNTPLHIAVSRGNCKIVKILLESSANLDIKNIDGETPLHMAVQNDKIDIVKILLDTNAEFNFNVNDTNKNILDVAILNENYSMVFLILEKCINLSPTINIELINHVGIRNLIIY